MPRISGGKFVLVGGASQIGSHIAEQLLAAYAREVVLLDNLSLGSQAVVQHLLQDRRCVLVRGDVLRLNELHDAFEGADGVFGVAGIMASSIRANPSVGMDVNIVGVLNTLEACRYQRVGRVVFSSSIGVYGSPVSQPTSEECPLVWQALTPSMSLYCASKVVGESLARFYREVHGIEFVALRYSAVYGERQHGRALVGGHIAQTCAQVRGGERPALDGDGQQTQDYIYAGDVARANLLAMEKPVAGEAFNICHGTGTTQREVVELVLRLCGSEVEPRSRDDASNDKLPPAAAATYSRDKAKRLLGWEPQVSIEQGIAKVLSWVDAQRDL
jgi:UDP-glucose 4-epimerase